MNFVKKIIIKILSKIPTTNSICYNSYPDYTDNAYAVFLYLKKSTKGKKYKHIWLVNEKSNVSIIQKKLSQEGFHADVVYKKSIYGLWFYIRCRYCFFTHGIFEKLPLHQHANKLINLWHGMPLKRIGNLDSTWGAMKNFDILISNGVFWSPIIASCFGVNECSVLPFGQPRNDLFFSQTDFFKKRNINPNSYNKIGAWLPTYMKSAVVNKERTDGETSKLICFLDENDLLNLDRELEVLNELLIIKLHPMDYMQHIEFHNYTNILILKQKDMDSQLYPLLGACDYLLTDYSSVCFDFDILHKPMAFPIGNLDSYKKKRGFVFDDITTVLPGPLIFNYKDLLTYIKNPYKVNSKVRINDFFDANASERLVNYLGI